MKSRGFCRQHFAYEPDPPKPKLQQLMQRGADWLDRNFPNWEDRVQPPEWPDTLI